jgi:hypothetical protein
MSDYLIKRIKELETSLRNAENVIENQAESKRLEYARGYYDGYDAMLKVAHEVAINLVRSVPGHRIEVSDDIRATSPTGTLKTWEDHDKRICVYQYEDNVVAV